MTSEQAMLSRSLATLIAVWAGAIGGCDLLPKKVERPQSLSSPYPAPKVWAVAPLRNESGTTQLDPLRVSDQIAQQVQQVHEIDVVPVNRVVEAMQAAKLREVGSKVDALALINTLDVDGLIVGSLSGWDPYQPPKIGATLQLYARTLPRNEAALDPKALTRAPSDATLPGLRPHRQPVATASGYFDAANGDVRARLLAYAEGRVPPESAGWRRYLLDMDLYGEFVSHELVRRLLGAEWKRLHGHNPARWQDAAARRSDD
jgi:hypothetical protein